MMKKSSAFVAVMCLGGLFTAGSASAGYWEQVHNEEIPYTPAWHAANEEYLDGMASYSVPSGWGRTPTQQTKTWAEIGPLEAGFGFSNWLTNFGYGGSASVFSYGTMKTKFKWVRDKIGGNDDPNDNPPPVLYVKVLASAGLMAQTNSDQVFNADMEVKIGEKEGVSESPVPYALENNLSGTFLLHVNTNGQEEVWVPGLRYQVNGNYHTNGSSSHYIDSYGNLSYSILFDNRSLKIESAREPSYHKPAVPTTPLVPVAHVRGTDDSMVIDTVAEIHEVESIPGIPPTSVKEWTGSVVLNATESGYADPEAEWTVDGPGEGIGSEPRLRLYDLDGPFAPGNMQAYFYAKFGADTALSSVNFPLSNTFKVVVTDTDGAIGTNTYTVNWHRPFEAYANITTGGYPAQERKDYQSGLTNLEVAAKTNINLDGSPVIFTIRKTFLGALEDYTTGVIDSLLLPSELLPGVWGKVISGLRASGVTINFNDNDMERSVTQNTSGMFAQAIALGLVPSEAEHEEYYLTSPFFYSKY